MPSLRCLIINMHHSQCCWFLFSLFLAISINNPIPPPSRRLKPELNSTSWTRLLSFGNYKDAHSKFHMWSGRSSICTSWTKWVSLSVRLPTGQYSDVMIYYDTLNIVSWNLWLISVTEQRPVRMITITITITL